MTNFRASSVVVLSLAVLGLTAPVMAGNGTTAGLSLVEAPSARASALAETFSAVPNDIAAFAYNPSLLGSLKTGQMSLLYQQGLVSDSYGHAMLGSPRPWGGWGFSLGYYNGGDIEAYDGTTTRTVTAQRDITFSLGGAVHRGNFDWGFAGKYLSSDLIERAHASTFAADLGLSMAATPRLRLGASLQNIGPKLTYVKEGNDLPRMARLGSAYAFYRRNVTATVLFDTAYRMVEADFIPSLGLEFAVGVLSLRTGVRNVSGETEITVGTGLLLGTSAIDYSLGLAQDVDAVHRISYSLRFGSGLSSASNPNLVRVPAAVPASEPVAQIAAEPPARAISPSTPATRIAPTRTVYRIDQVSSAPRQVRTYILKPGDTLASVAKDVYGDHRLWKKIYGANKHLIADPTEVEVGQKIVIP